MVGFPKKELIIVSFSDCPNCGAKGDSNNTGFRCPVYWKEFCCQCYGTKPDSAEKTRYLFCLACGEKLFFPKGIWRGIWNNLYRLREKKRRKK